MPAFSHYAMKLLAAIICVWCSNIVVMNALHYQGVYSDIWGSNE